MKLKVILISLLCFSLSALVQAYESPEAYRQQAYNKISVSMQLVEQARALIDERPSRQSVQSAIGLLTKAGQGFEEAGNMMRALGPDWVPESEVAQCDQAVQDCVNFIMYLNEQLQKMR